MLSGFSLNTFDSVWFFVIFFSVVVAVAVAVVAVAVVVAVGLSSKLRRKSKQQPQYKNNEGPDRHNWSIRQQQ